MIRYMPERFVPLTHTSIHTRLSSEERTRYNQLHALYVNEQITWFEVLLAKRVIEGAIRAGVSPELEAGLRTFLREEAAHTEMFRALNREIAPALYAGRDFWFVRPSRSLLLPFQWAANHPTLFPLFFWFLLLQEEKAAAVGREFLRDADAIDPRFVAVHRRHLADEIDHIRWDEELLDRFWDGCSSARRRWNARAFAWLTREFFLMPKRGGRRVLEEWLREFPAREAERARIEREFAALEENDHFLASIYSRELTPRAFARFDRYEEFRAFERAFRLYRQPVSA